MYLLLLLLLLGCFCQHPKIPKFTLVMYCVDVVMYVYVRVQFTIVWRITRWTRDCQPFPSQKEHRAHTDGCMGKDETSHTPLNKIPLLKGDSNCSLLMKNPWQPEQGLNPCFVGWVEGRDANH